LGILFSAASVGFWTVTLMLGRRSPVGGARTYATVMIVMIAIVTAFPTVVLGLPLSDSAVETRGECGLDSVGGMLISFFVIFVPFLSLLIPAVVLRAMKSFRWPTFVGFVLGGEVALWLTLTLTIHPFYCLNHSWLLDRWPTC